MKLFAWLGLVAVLLINVAGCEPHQHHSEVLNETVVEQTEVVE